VLAHDPSADCPVRRAQVITLLVGQHVESDAHPQCAPDQPTPTSTETHGPADQVAFARSSAPTDVVDAAAHDRDGERRVRPAIAADPTSFAAQRTARELDQNIEIEPHGQRTLELAPRLEPDDRPKAVRRRQPRHRLLASIALCMGVAATGGLLGLRAGDGTAPKARRPVALPPRSVSSRRHEAEPAFPPRAPMRREIPRRKTSARTTQHDAGDAPAVARPHAVVSQRERIPIPAPAVSAVPTGHATRLSAASSRTPAPALPPSPAGQLPGPPPT
jgi:hypothetical protein